MDSAMTVTTAQIDEILKTLYKDKVPEVGHKDPVLWSILKKTTDFKGRNSSVSTQYSRTKGRSRTFATARTNAAASDFTEWLVTRARDYAVVQIEVEAIEAASDYGAKVNYLKRESKSAMDKLKHNMCRSAYRNTGGAVARLLAAGAGGATQTITVQEPTDLIFLDIGDTLVSSNTDGTSGAVDANGTVISAIDRIAGTITTAAASWDAIAGFSDNDFVFVEGDFGGAFAGLASWIPDTDPTATLFFNVNRSVDVVRLGGQRIVAEESDGNLEAFLKRAITEHGVQGGMADICTMHPTHWDQLSEHLGSKVRYEKVPGRNSDGESPLVGFKAIQICADSRVVNVLADRDCPRDQSYLIDLDHFWFKGLGEAPRYIEQGSQGGWLRMDSEDAMEGRIVSRGNFVCDAPGKLANLDLTNVV